MEKVTGEKQANILGFCIGGILTTAMLAYMAARKDTRIKSATMLATLVDLKDVGEVSVFVDEEQVQNIERHAAEKGYLEGHHMMDMFSMIRENDLIWSFVVNNYLMGREPMPFDLLYWNADSTRLPATMLVYYLRKVYLENGLVRPGHLVLDGVPIDLRKIKTPCYFLATKDDHIAPWHSTYPATQVLRGPVRFVLGGSGHIAGVMNPPVANKYGYWTNDEAPPSADDWLAGAAQNDGSWWTDWGQWLAKHGGRKVPAREPGESRRASRAAACWSRSRMPPALMSRCAPANRASGPPYRAEPGDALKPIGLHRIAGEQPRPVGGDEDLLFELDALLAALDPDEGLDAERHPFLEAAVIALGLPIDPVFQRRILVGQPHAVDQRSIAIGQKLLGYRPGLLGHLAEGLSRFQDPDVVLDLLVGGGIEPLLLIARLTVTAQPRPRDIRAIAVRPDQVGVEAHQFSRLDLAHGTLAKPGIGARPRREKTRFDPLSPQPNIGLVQLGP
jgi:hypothetical protein